MIVKQNDIIAPIKHRGVSLVELLIAMTLGLLLLAGMIAVFSGNQRSSELNTAMANIQENARFALSALGKDIRMAGYQGCLDSRRGRMTVKATVAPIPVDGVLPNGQPNFNSNLSAATGSVVQPNGDWWPPIPGGFQPPAVNPAIPGTHALAVQYGNSNQSALVGPVQTGGIPDLAGPANTVGNLALAVGDLALISNCESVDLFTVTAANLFGTNGQSLGHAAPQNRDGNFTSRYGVPRNIRHTKVMRFESRVYYVGDTGLVNENGDQIRALYMQSYPYNDPNNPPSELVQGVENMRLAFGIRNNDTLRYVRADDPAFDPEEVEAIQVGLIMSSFSRIAEQNDTNTYVIAGQSILPSAASINALTHPEDGRYRLVFNTTVKVRNRRDERIAFEAEAPPAPPGP